MDKLKYSTVGRSSCLVLVQWIKGQPRTVNPCLFKCHVLLLYIALCVYGVCEWVGGWIDVWVWVCVCVWGGGGMSEGDHRPPSPVICKSHEL